MPLGPTGYGDSPYQCFSAFAGNPYLISLDKLVEEGLLDESALENAPDFPADEVDYGAVIPFKLDVLNQSYEVFKERATEKQKESFNEFSEAQAYWLDDYALFMSCKEANEGRAWGEWDEGLRKRKKRALNAHQKEHAETIERWRYWQWLFYTQWLEVKRYANERDIKIIGDIPIFIAYDSADAWANPGAVLLRQGGQSNRRGRGAARLL